MSRKLKVQELENRIAPGVGLFSFLQGLAQTDSQVGELFNQFVTVNDDGTAGDVDVQGAVDAANTMMGANGIGTSVQAVRDSFTLSDNIVISDATAQMIASIFGK